MSTPTTVPAPAARAGELPEQLVAEVISVRPHDPGAFTQGLLLHDGDLYESTGLTGRSSLRQVEPLTGEVKRRRELAPELFGEGLALAGGRLVQITWQDGRAFSYDLADWAAAPREFRYSGEGWGLCADGSRLVMSDGSSRLTFRDPSTFEPTGGVSVTLAGQPVERLNELECVDGEVYANVWQTDEIVRIDAAGGVVTGVVRADGLLTPAERQATDVLNGIAYDPQTGHFLITGKLWPKLFEVAFVPRATPP
jgi:glutaminyl-peptide cyclotransferase